MKELRPEQEHAVYILFYRYFIQSQNLDVLSRHNI